MRRRRDDEEAREVEQKARASQGSRINQAGGDINISHHQVVRPKRGLSDNAQVIWFVLSILLAFATLPNYWTATDGPNGETYAAMYAAGTLSNFVTGIVLYLVVRALWSHRNGDGLLWWWVRGALLRAVLAGPLWWLTVHLINAALTTWRDAPLGLQFLLAIHR